MAYMAIETKFLGPTNYRGARIRACSNAKSITVAWDHNLNVGDNHDAAAKELADLMGWRGRWYSGASLCGRGNVYVNAWNGGETFVIEARQEDAA